MVKRRTAAQNQAMVAAVERDRAKGLAVADSRRRHGITEQSYYRGGGTPRPTPTTSAGGSGNSRPRGRG